MKKCTFVSMSFAGALENLGQYKQINKRVLLCVPLISLRSLSDPVPPLHFLQQQSTLIVLEGKQPRQSECLVYFPY